MGKRATNNKPKLKPKEDPFSFKHIVFRGIISSTSLPFFADQDLPKLGGNREGSSCRCRARTSKVESDVRPRISQHMLCIWLDGEEKGILSEGRFLGKEEGSAFLSNSSALNPNYNTQRRVIVLNLSRGSWRSDMAFISSRTHSSLIYIVPRK